MDGEEPPGWGIFGSLDGILRIAAEISLVSSTSAPEALELPVGELLELYAMIGELLEKTRATSGEEGNSGGK